MLPKRHRLTVVDYRRNKSRTKSFSSQWFALFSKPSDKAYPRFVFVVPKKLNKRSVCRNQTRRIMVEAIRNYLDKINTPLSFDILIKLKKIITKKEAEELNKKIEKIFIKAGYIK